MSSHLSDLSPGAHPELIREAELLFALSRRHALPFSVVALIARERAIDASHERAIDGGHGRSLDAGHGRALDTRHERVAEHDEVSAEAGRVERALAPLLRATDVLVAWPAPDHYVVFCSGTGAAGATELVRRLESAAHGLSIALGRASFGEDGLVLADLVAHAWSKVPRSRSAVHDVDEPPDRGALRLVESGRPPRRASQPIWRRRLSERVKRLFDLSFVAALAPFWLPSFGFLALAIKLSDPSAPVLFVQPRTGRGGRRFPMYKFRTMVPNAEQLKSTLRDRNELAWPDFKIKSDPRITWLGRVLRKTSLDELPQLLNVLRGDMSLVGPRPTSFAAGTYAPWQTARLEVQPGITGLWQVEGRASTAFDERLRIELDYIARRSFLLDLWILARTVPAVLQMRGGH